MCSHYLIASTHRILSTVTEKRMQQFNYPTQPCRISFHLWPNKIVGRKTIKRKTRRIAARIDKWIFIELPSPSLTCSHPPSSPFHVPVLLYVVATNFYLCHFMLRFACLCAMCTMHGICIYLSDSCRSEHIKNKLKIFRENSNVIKINAHELTPARTSYHTRSERIHNWHAWKERKNGSNAKISSS